MLEKHKFESHWSLKARMTWTKKNNEAGKPQEPLGPDSHKGLNQNSNQQPCRLEHFEVATGACRNTECQSAAAFSHLIQNKVVVGICLVKNALSLWDLPSPWPAEPLQCLLSLGAASLHKKTVMIPQANNKNICATFKHASMDNDIQHAAQTPGLPATVKLAHSPPLPISPHPATEQHIGVVLASHDPEMHCWHKHSIHMFWYFVSFG